MTSPLTLFESAVPHYALHRSGYPRRNVDELAAAIGLDAARQAVDIGCGSGQLTLHLARHAGTVFAIDPLSGMLEYGRKAARAAGLRNITWLQGDSSRLAVLVPPGARAATFAASFHWTDRARVLSDLDTLLEPGGSVVVLDDVLDDAGQPDWVHAVDDVRAGYPGLEPAPGALRPLPESHVDVLRSSAFSDVRTSIWSWTRQLDLEQVVGLHLSYSFSTPALLGDRLDRFCEEVRDAVLALHPGGTVTEPLRIQLLTAARPGTV